MKPVNIITVDIFPCLYILLSFILISGPCAILSRPWYNLFNRSPVGGYLGCVYVFCFPVTEKATVTSFVDSCLLGTWVNYFSRTNF